MSETKSGVPKSNGKKESGEALQPPPKPPHKAFRLKIELSSPRPRLDAVLMDELRKQDRNLALKNISRVAFKELFNKKKVRIKGQPARPSSALASGVTWVDILGFDDA